MKIDLTDTQSAKLAEARQRAIDAATQAREAESRYLDLLAVIFDAHGLPPDREGVKILPDASALIVPARSDPEDQADSA